MGILNEIFGEMIELPDGDHLDIMAADDADATNDDEEEE